MRQCGLFEVSLLLPTFNGLLKNSKPIYNPVDPISSLWRRQHVVAGYLIYQKAFEWRWAFILNTDPFKCFPLLQLSRTVARRRTLWTGVTIRAASSPNRIQVSEQFNLHSIFHGQEFWKFTNSSASFSALNESTQKTVPSPAKTDAFNTSSIFNQSSSPLSPIYGDTGATISPHRRMNTRFM